MADTKISELPAVVTPADTDEFAVADGTASSKKETRAQIVSGVRADLNSHKTSADHDGRYYTESEIDAQMSGKEPSISPKNSAFNKDFGTTAGTAAEGNDPRFDNVQPIPGATMEYVWDSDTTATAPGTPGGIKANNASMAAVTEIYIDDLTALSNNFSFLFGDMQEGDFCQIHEIGLVGGSPDGASTFQITGASTDNTGWWTLTVANAATEGTMTDGKSVLFTFVRDPANKLPLGGLEGQALTKIDATDHNTKWGEPIWHYLAGVLHGVISATTKGVAMFYTPTGIYNPADGGFEAVSGGTILHGAAQVIESMAGQGGGSVDVSDEGLLSVRPNPAPSWSLNDTSNEVVAVGALNAWVEIAGADPLIVTTTAGEPISTGDLISFQGVVRFTNTAVGNNDANIEIGIGVDGADPESGRPFTIPAGTTDPISIQASLDRLAPGDAPAGTTYSMFIRTTNGTGAPVADGSGALLHTLLVRKSTSGEADQKDLKVSAADTDAGFLEAKLTQADGTPLAQVDLGGGNMQARLPPVGAPGAHAATHRDGGGDAVQLTQSQIDNLTTDLAGKETAGAAATVQGNLDTHTGDQTNPHSVSAAQTGADPAGSASSAITTHEASTDVHNLAAISDAGTAASHNVPVTGDAAAGEVVKGSDTRLTDSRDPNAHTHPLADITDSGSMAAVNDAISDGNQYARKDGGWSAVDTAAATERVITQSGALSLEIANDETVTLTTDNALVTVTVAAPAAGEATIGTLTILDGGAGNNIAFTGPVAGDWANGGNVPDLTASRHTVGAQRTAGGTYTMTHGAHQ